MDFYHYYMRRLDKFADKSRALDSAKDIAIRMLDNSPTAWGIESAADLLAVMHDWSNPDGIEILPAFEEVELALAQAISGIKVDISIVDAIHDENREDPPESRFEPETSPGLLSKMKRFALQLVTRKKAKYDPLKSTRWR